MLLPNNTNEITVDRVQQTLKKLGFPDSVVRDICEGKITLFCPDADRNDHSMIQAAIRLIPGVKSVAIATKPEKDKK